MLGGITSDALLISILAWSVYNVLPIGLELLNFPHLKRKLPKALRPYYDAREYKQIQERWQSASVFKIVKTGGQFIIGLLFIYFAVFTLLDNWLSEWLLNDYLLIIGFTMAIILIADLVLLPFDYVEFWILPKRFQSTHNSPPFYKHALRKVANALLLGVFAGGMICLLFFWKQDIQGMWFAAWAWLCLFVVWFVLNRAIGALIGKAKYNASAKGINTSQIKVLEIWQKSRPIWEVIPNEGLLAKNIQSACKNFNFSHQNIFVYPYEGNGKNYGHAFAYNKQIFLSETLIHKLSIEEVEAIFYHELWHTQNANWLKGVSKPLIWLLVFTLFGFSVSYGLPIVNAFDGELSGMHLQVLSFAIVLLPFKYLWSALWNGYSRYQERKADMFALNLTDERVIQNALGTLSGWNLEVPEPNSLYQWFFYSHPPISERIDTASSTADTDELTHKPIRVEELTHQIETLRNSLNYSGSSQTPKEKKEARKSEIQKREKARAEKKQKLRKKKR